MKLHPKITVDVLLEAVQQTTFGLENKGFCNACGMEHDSCEPDMRKGECENCGENAVYGAEELMIHTQI